MEEPKGNQKKMFGKAIGAVSKIGKGTSIMARRGLAAAAAVSTTVAHAATLHSNQEGNSDDEGDDNLRDLKVMELFRALQLQGGNPHSHLIVAVAKGKLACDWSDGITHDRLVNINWFRVGGSDGGESFIPLPGVSGSTYQPSVDDIGARISAQCYDSRNPAVCRFAEIGPLLPDGSLVAAVDGILQDEILRAPIVELKIASKWSQDNSKKKNSQKESENSDDSDNDNDDTDDDEQESNNTISNVVKSKEETVLKSHQVSLELNRLGLLVSACESDTPRGLNFLLPSTSTNLNNATTPTMSLLDGYDNTEEDVMSSDHVKEEEEDHPLPRPSITLHPTDPVRVDVVFNVNNNPLSLNEDNHELPQSHEKWHGLVWFGDHGGELWGYMELCKDKTSSLSSASSSSSSSSKSKQLEFLSNQEDRTLLSVTLQLQFPDPTARDVFTVAARAFTSEGSSKENWDIPWEKKKSNQNKSNSSSSSLSNIKNDKKDDSTFEGENINSSSSSSSLNQQKQQKQEQQDMIDLSSELKLTIDHLKGDLNRSHIDNNENKEMIEKLKLKLKELEQTSILTGKKITLKENEIETLKQSFKNEKLKLNNKINELEQNCLNFKKLLNESNEKVIKSENKANTIEAELLERVIKAENNEKDILIKLEQLNENNEKLKLESNHYKRIGDSLKKECEKGRRAEEIAAKQAIQLKEAQATNETVF